MEKSEKDFGLCPVCKITGMLKVMDVVTKQLMAKTKDVNDISNVDVYTAALMRRQMNAATDVQTMIFKNVPKGNGLVGKSR